MSAQGGGRPQAPCTGASRKSHPCSCHPVSSLQQDAPCPGQFPGAHRILCTTRRLGLNGGEGPSAWHPWPHILVISHLLPLCRALEQMYLPSSSGRTCKRKGRHNATGWESEFLGSNPRQGPGQHWVPSFDCEVSVPRASPAPCRPWAGLWWRACLLATPPTSSFFWPQVSCFQGLHLQGPHGAAHLWLCLQKELNARASPSPSPCCLH